MTDRFARFVAVCTVLTTLAAAGVGYVSARAARDSGGDKVGALQLSLDSLARQIEANRAAYLQLDRFTLAQKLRREAMNARSERLLFQRDERALTLEERRNEWLADRIERVSGQLARATGVSALTLNGRDGPATDKIAFPSRYLARNTTLDEQRLLALRDTTNEQELSRSRRLSAYSVTLALFAIAVFLFGFSLTPEGRIRGGLFAGTAGVLAIAGMLVTVGAGLRGPPDPPPQAAEAYARGSVAIEVGDYRTAIRELDRAIELNPDLARAWRARSTAEFRASSPQLTGYPSLTSPEALRRSNADLRKALDLGGDTPDLRLSLGFGLFEEGLMERDDDLLKEAVDVSRRAVAANPLDPVA
ncbi:MAG: hypothetical protein HOQ03_10020, partial [Thermoleophilia bacterium]|nr:hypothetical protein [Thermoleophilia bacterium]